MKKLILILLFFPIFCFSQQILTSPVTYSNITELRKVVGVHNVIVNVNNLMNQGDRSGSGYMWDSTSVAVDNGYSVLKVTGKIKGRYLRQSTNVITRTGTLTSLAKIVPSNNTLVIVDSAMYYGGKWHSGTYRYNANETGPADVTSRIYVSVNGSVGAWNLGAPVTKIDSVFGTDSLVNAALAASRKKSDTLYVPKIGALAAIGLPNVNNTADLDKPVSTFQKAYVDAETLRASSAEGAESSRAAAAESTLSTAVNTEKSRAQSAEAVLQAGVSAVASTLAGKEPTIAIGTTGQYYRGDKTFQTLNTAAVPESGNLYYTDARAFAYLSAHPFVVGAGAKALLVTVAIGASSVAISFDKTMPSTAYNTTPIMPAGATYTSITNKTTTGCTLNFTATALLAIGTNFTVIATQQTP
jgi:hypothetical protein